MKNCTSIFVQTNYESHCNLIHNLQVHSATDVLLCTASILNITLISLDRYFSITRALEYLNFRSEVTVTVMICAVWLLSALVSMPLLVYTPWNFPFSPPKDNEIILSARDRQTLDQFNATQVLAESRCSVSHSLRIVETLGPVHLHN